MMDAQVQAKLREKFDVERIGKKPKITCPACRDARTKACDKHPKSQCRDCGQWITPKHMHIEFVGHANVTDRLLEVDPAWTWEPMAFGPDGLPAFDAHGGLWIRLTVAGVTRIGYGGSDGKRSEDAVKEAISDALKTGSMRFGVGLDLWRKEEASGKTADEAPAPEPADRATPDESGQPSPDEGPTPTQARAALAATCEQNGWDLEVVAGLYAAVKGSSLREATDVDSITKFREYLFTLPQAELQPAAKEAAA